MRKQISSKLDKIRKNRHLISEFVIRDIKDRYAGSIGGLLWSLVSPLVSILVFLFIFSTVLRIRVSIEEVGTGSFFIYFLSGYLPWLLFSESITRSTGVILENANLIKKVVFPVEILPIETIISASVLSGAGFMIFFIYLLYAGYLSVQSIAVIPLFVLFFAFIWGICSFLSALCVFIRDIKEILALVLMVWFYATPIIYPISMVPEGTLRKAVQINPLTAFVTAFRGILLETSVHWQTLLYATAVSLFSFFLGAWFFMRAKPAFGDVL